VRALPSAGETAWHLYSATRRRRPATQSWRDYTVYNLRAYPEPRRRGGLDAGRFSRRACCRACVARGWIDVKPGGLRRHGAQNDRGAGNGRGRTIAAPFVRRGTAHGGSGASCGAFSAAKTSQRWRQRHRAARIACTCCLLRTRWRAWCCWRISGKSEGVGVLLPGWTPGREDSLGGDRCIKRACILERDARWNWAGRRNSLGELGGPAEFPFVPLRSHAACHTCTGGGGGGGGGGISLSFRHFPFRLKAGGPLTPTDYLPWRLPVNSTSY